MVLHDAAVLRLDREAIKRLGLEPAPISFHVRQGAAVIARGFDRPWHAASLATYRGTVPDDRVPFTKLRGEQRAFLVRLKAVWQRGLSGGAIFDTELGALIGIACAVEPDRAAHAVTTSRLETGCATAMHEVGEGWTVIGTHCRAVSPEDGTGRWPRPPRIVHPLPPAYRYRARPGLEEDLRRFWARNQGGVVGLVGLGGTGKTCLVERFLRDLANPIQRRDLGLPEPDATFVFSFYNAPPEGCLEELAGYLAGDGEAPRGSRSLAALQALWGKLRGRRVLVVLDGLERVQRDIPLGTLRADAGAVRDLLCWCADGQPGLWVLATSRLPLADLRPYRERAYQELEVDQLDPEAALALVRDLGVLGSPEELRVLLDRLGCHPLTLIHASLCLAEFHDGRAAAVEELERPTPDGGGGGLEAFAGESGESRRASLRMPAGPALRRVLVRLRDLHLVYEHRDADGTRRYAAHPVVNQFFYRALEEDALLVHLGASEYLTRKLSGAGDFRVPVRGAVRTRGSVRIRGRPTEGRTPEPAVLNLLEEAIHHMLLAGRVVEAWGLYQERLGFDHLESAGEMERGYRIVQELLEHARQHAEAVDAVLAEVRAEHGRYREALGGDGRG